MTSAHLSRRDLFRSGLRRAVEATARAVRSELPSPATEPSAQASLPNPSPPPPAFLRPPGALEEAEFLARCTRCDACIAACPRWSIRRAGFELGPENEGTPVIIPTEQPCWLCADLPCIPACEPGALAPLASPNDARMASVRIHEEACFSAQGSPCEVCSERCPTRPKAITWQHGEAPVLDDARCTGCAVCAWLCPAGAIDLVAPVLQNHGA